MKILIDTPVLLWVVDNHPRLRPELRLKIENAEVVFVSIASLWEIAVKVSIGKLDFNDLVKITENLESFGFELLPIHPEHLLHLAKLPFIHRDPFDRMLIAQAQTEPLILITEDAAIQLYF